MTVNEIINSPLRSIRELVSTSAETGGDKIAYMYKEGDIVREVSYRAFYEDCRAIGAALFARGFRDTHIATVGENSYPWLVTYLSTLMSSSVFVPIDRELPPDSVTLLLNRGKCTVVFYDAAHEEMLRQNRDKLPRVALFVGFAREEDDGEFLSYKKLLAEGHTLPKDAYDASSTPDGEMKLLVYTSGTTGVAKGVMITEHNLVSAVYYGLQCSRVEGVGLSVLPYHHTYEAVTDILVSIRCQTTLFINDSLRHVLPNIQLARPDYLYIVPMFLDVFYNNVQKNIEKQGKTKLVNRFIKISNFLRKFKIDLRYVLFKSIHKAFGGNLRKIVCGGAPIRPEVSQFFLDIGMEVFGGYGITECSPLVSLNTEKCMSSDTAGQRIPCVEWRIEEPNEEGIGEICVKGDVVMKGYYEEPDKTAEVIRDGWFYTGDYGRITDKDQLQITGRKKNIIVLNNGKNIYPEEIEGYVSRVPYIEEVLVRGIKNQHGQEEALLAEVFLKEPHPESEVLADIRRELSVLPSYKSISKVVIRDTEFEKTTTRKIKRNYN